MSCNKHAGSGNFSSFAYARSPRQQAADERLFRCGSGTSISTSSCRSSSSERCTGSGPTAAAVPRATIHFHIFDVSSITVQPSPSHKILRYQCTLATLIKRNTREKQTQDTSSILYCESKTSTTRRHHSPRPSRTTDAHASSNLSLLLHRLVLLK